MIALQKIKRRSAPKARISPEHLAKHWAALVAAGEKIAAEQVQTDERRVAAP